MAGTLVVVQAPDGAVSRSSLELVGGGRVLDGAVGVGHVAAALLCTTDAPGAAEALHQYGVATVYRVIHPALGVGQADAVLTAALAVCAQARPDLVLVAGDTVGREVAPRLAYRLGAALVTDCVALGAEDGAVVARRQVYGGRAVAAHVVRRRPAVLSVKPRALDAPGPAPTSGRVVDVAVTIDSASLATRVIQVQVEKAELGLEDAQIVVGGGRGLGGPDGFALLQELAAALGGAIGSSRPPADAGWVPISWQIGQTGKTIRPALYIAVGISGATQHVAGMAGARTIVAINRDPEAPIFGVAHLGVVGDYREVVPALIAGVRAARGR